MAKIALINPKFESSYWGLEHSLPIFGKSANMPTSALPLLAALTPSSHEVVLIDENVEEIDYEQLDGFDIVGLTGMIVQRERMQQIFAELKFRDHYVIVGGPWVTVQEDSFAEAAETIFVGEAEETWPQFLKDFEAGTVQKRYEQNEKTDLSTVPAPRLDLLKTSRYMFGSVQFSRGCPFQCEFCDIIVTFGRKPRVKTADQVIVELENLRAQGLKFVFIVDDNLIGDKKEIRPVLKRVIDWQKENGYPLTFFTEASLNLAENDEILQLFVAANIQCVFLGIESPDPESLKEAKKMQNINTKASLLERIHKIQDCGIEVWCGMIVGFDNDDESVFSHQKEFLEEARIGHAMLGMLTAIPKTPLYSRLQKDGRLNEEAIEKYGTNVVPKKMTREQLKNGYIETMSSLYSAESFFSRIDRLYIDGGFVFDQGRRNFWKTNRLRQLAVQSTELFLSIVLYMRLNYFVKTAELRRFYRRRFFNLVRKRKSPSVWMVYLIKCVMHYHHYLLSKELNSRENRLVNTF